MTAADAEMVEEEEGAAAGTTAIGRAGAEAEKAAGTTTIALIGTTGAAVAEVAKVAAAAAAIRAGATLRIKVRPPLAMIFRGEMTMAAEEQVALGGGIMILAVDLVGVVAAAVAAVEEVEAKEEVEVLDAVAAEAIATTARTTTNPFPRKHGGCSSLPTSPSNT